MPPANQRLNMLFSATLSYRVRELAFEQMNNAEYIEVEPEQKTGHRIKEELFYPSNEEKMRLLQTLIEEEWPDRAIIFANTKHRCEEIWGHLAADGHRVGLLTGDVAQKKRLRILDEFTRGDLDILVATDVAARGLHIPAVTHVFNYDIPDDCEDYVHRIGRTGRANREGKAYTIVVGKEERYLKEIERKTKSHIEKLEVPTLTQIHQHKVTELMYKLEDMILHGEHKPMKDMVNQIENHMLKDVTAALIELSLNQEIGFPYTKEKLESSSKRKKGASEGYTRLFLTVGSMDKVKKKDIIHFLVSKANIRESDIQGIDIKRKFTFVNINDKAVKKVMRHCQKEKLNGRKVEIEQANSR